MKEVYFTPIQAWLGSLTRVLLWPLIGWVLLAILSAPWNGPASLFFVFSGFVGMLVHFVAYLIIGLPIYQFCWVRFPNLWTWRLGLIAGVVAGGIAMVVLGFTWGGFRAIRGDEIITIFLIGGLYGLITAIAAIIASGREARK